MSGKKALIAAAAVVWAFAASGAWADTNSGQPVSDTWITTQVKAELAKDKATKATQIHVDTKDGVVSLTGAVGSVAEKEKAAENAKGIKGVVAVTNNLKVAE